MSKINEAIDRGLNALKKRVYDKENMELTPFGTVCYAFEAMREPEEEKKEVCNCNDCYSDRVVKGLYTQEEIKEKLKDLIAIAEAYKSIGIVAIPEIVQTLKNFGITI